MGAYVAFLDVALGIGGPATGLVANRFGVDAVFLAGAAIVARALIVAVRLMAAAPRQA